MTLTFFEIEIEIDVPSQRIRWRHGKHLKNHGQMPSRTFLSEPNYDSDPDPGKKNAHILPAHTENDNNAVNSRHLNRRDMRPVQKKRIIPGWRLGLRRLCLPREPLFCFWCPAIWVALIPVFLR